MKKDIRISLLVLTILVSFFLGSGLVNATTSKIPCKVDSNFSIQGFDFGPLLAADFVYRWYVIVGGAGNNWIPPPYREDPAPWIISTSMNDPNRPFGAGYRRYLYVLYQYYCAKTGESIIDSTLYMGSESYPIAPVMARYMPTINSFTAEPASISAGQSSTLSWASVRSSECSIDGVGGKPINGTMTVSPTVTTTYKMECSTIDFISTPKTVTITVKPAETISSPVITSFTASPASITSGQSSTLSWASTNADKCSISGLGDVSTSGTKVVSPTNTTTYDMTCYKGTTASNARTTTVTVAGTSSSGSTSENPYAGSLSNAAKNTINTWITKNIKSRSTTLSSADYTKFVETIISRLNQIKAATPASNVNKLNVINYLVWELQQILSESIFDGLFS